MHDIEDYIQHGELRQYTANCAPRRDEHKARARKPYRSDERPPQTREEKPCHGQRSLGLPKPPGHVGQISHVPSPPPEKPIPEIVYVIMEGIPEEVSQAFWRVEANRVPPKEPCDKRLKGDEVITFS